MPKAPNVKISNFYVVTFNKTICLHEPSLNTIFLFTSTEQQKSMGYWLSWSWLEPALESEFRETESLMYTDHWSII